MSLARQPIHLRGPLGVSIALHASILALAFIVYREHPTQALPPFYRVDLVAAPKGERAIGEVKPPEAKPEPTPPVAAPVAPPQKSEKAVPLTKAAPKKEAARSTPVPTPPKAAPQTNAPKAGGGPIGGAGTDVGTIHIEGIDFPFPGYLNNIVRQIFLRFKPTDTNSGYSADVMFLIHRNGEVDGIRFIKRSGAYAFDLEARGAIEEAAKYFGALPDGFRDDVLPVVFSFDPRLLR